MIRPGRPSWNGTSPSFWPSSSPYVSSFERIAQKKGMEKGIGQGQARLLHLQIQQRFGLIPPEIAVRIEAGQPEQLERWALRVLDAVCLDDVFRPDSEH